MTPAVAAAEGAGIAFKLHQYQHDPNAASYGLEAAQALGVAPERVFKTLVALCDERELIVGIVPVAGSLDLKALARALGGKKAAMAPMDRAEKATGYVAGGISPLGQRRRLKTVLDDSALNHATIFVSAGRRGLEIELAPTDLLRLCAALSAPIGRAAQ